MVAVGRGRGCQSRVGHHNGKARSPSGASRTRYLAREKACEFLAPTISLFTEGFDTRDLIEAKALLEHMSKGA
jgi:hypothetical protein